MVTIYKTDMDPSAQAYLTNSVNNILRPYTSGSAPPYTNTGKLTDYPRQPAHSWPSRYLSGAVNAQKLKELMIALASNYSMLGRGTWGLHNTDLEKNTTWISNTGHSVFALAGVNNGIAGAAAGAPLPTIPSPINHARASDIYGYGWNALQAACSGVHVDLTVCHSSCHISCHGSRGRR
jgi:hypothetical protein